MSTITEHELKIWPEYFDDVESGKKPFEVRKLDRLFGKGDTLFLREWSPVKGYSGRETRKTITYVMAGGQWGLQEGNCILGIAGASAMNGSAGVWVKAKDKFPEKSGSYFLRHAYEDGRHHGMWVYVVPEAIDREYWIKMGYEWLDESVSSPSPQINSAGSETRCKCGHLHSEHAAVKPEHYYSGRCMVGECRCAQFVSDGSKSPPSPLNENKNHLK